MKDQLYLFITLLLLVALNGCQQDSAPTQTLRPRASYSPYGSGEVVPLRWPDSQLISGLPLKIATVVAADLDYGNGNNGYVDGATEWNNAVSDKTFFILPMPQVANRQKAQLTAYFDDEMGIYRADNWYSEVGNGALAITQFFGVRRSSSSGQFVELIHADIIINYHDYIFTNDPNDFTRYDLPSVILHEMGHFIGLRHNYDTYDTVMRPSLGSYESERQIYPDDIRNLKQNYGIQSNLALNAAIPSSSAKVIASAQTSEGNEIVQGRFELRSDGRCVHILNGKKTAEHFVGQ